jgi:secreted PhoX family phosphatase
LLHRSGVDGDLLALPPGFSYRVVAQAGVTTMPDGALTPDHPDGSSALVWSREYGAQAIVRSRVVPARNPAGGNVYGEMTGPCFSPDGRILLVSVQVPGYTFAISCPWATYR